ncbi:MAG: IS66 family insertion sequence element accessory protein TnpB [Anaerocolumna sp.]
MLDFTSYSTVYFACGVTDCRKSFNGLAAIIKLKFRLDPYSRAMFVFCNRNHNILKILQWDGSGFWLFMKRLDKGSFHWPATADEIKQVSTKELRWLCEGLEIEQKSAFKERHPKLFI